MAQLQVTIRYKSLAAKSAFILLMATTPIWALGAAIVFGYMIGTVLASPYSVPLATLCTVAPGMILLMLAGLAATSFAENNRIYLSKDGISFPLFFLRRMGMKRHRNWDEVVSADLSSGKYLFLVFADGKSLHLRTTKFSNGDLEQLLMGIEVWSPNCKRSDELVEFQNQLQNETQGLGQIGYTQMWEEELHRRFQLTSFVPLEPGMTLKQGKLKVVRQLAFGGLSAIYLAQKDQTDFVVLKEAVIPPKANETVRASAEKHLVREAEILSRLNHPRIAKVLDHFVDGGRHYLQLEYINGTDLRQYVRQNGALDQTTAIGWALQILEILTVLHNHEPPIIHRDLTPENLVLSKENIILIDFGAANEFVGSATGTIVGKQAYMPPEQLRGKATLQSDLYAFAGTMHYLLTGKDPVPLAVARPRSVDETIDAQLDAFIAKCSAFEPEDRFASAAQAQEVLLECMTVKR
jgi:predicted Ser/Thr protein kinase